MSCGCNKVRSFSETSPLILGESDGSPSVNVRCTVAIMGLRAGSEFWASGTGVPAMIDSGWLVRL